jgi:hypothetical protein
MSNQFYVYVYSDPVSNDPFYIGKGCKRRHRRHLFETWNNTTNKLRFSKICSIRNKGLEPAVSFYATYITEEEALQLEKELISKYGKKIDGTGILTNILDGGNQPPPGKGNPNWSVNNPSSLQKGLTYEKRYGVNRAKDIKRQRSVSLTNRAFSNETKTKMSTSAKLRTDREYLKKQIQTPDGIFNSCTQCAQYYSISPSTVTYRLKTNSDWVYK